MTSTFSAWAWYTVFSFSFFSRSWSIVPCWPLKAAVLACKSDFSTFSPVLMPAMASLYSLSPIRLTRLLMSISPAMDLTSSYFHKKGRPESLPFVFVVLRPLHSSYTGRL